jgi:hypothetical protein
MSDALTMTSLSDTAAPTSSKEPHNPLLDAISMKSGVRSLTDAQVARLVQMQVPNSMPHLRNPAAAARSTLMKEFKTKKVGL